MPLTRTLNSVYNLSILIEIGKYHFQGVIRGPPNHVPLVTGQ